MPTIIKHPLPNNTTLRVHKTVNKLSTVYDGVLEPTDPSRMAEDTMAEIKFRTQVRIRHGNSVASTVASLRALADYLERTSKA